jgi:four helix bundle protein
MWQRAMGVCTEIIKLTAAFPKQHQYGLVQQMQHSAISIPSNIAEGYNRNSTKEYSYFLSVALGSTGELETQCELAVQTSLGNVADFNPLIEELDEIGKMLRASIRTLSNPSPRN